MSNKADASVVAGIVNEAAQIQGARKAAGRPPLRDAELGMALHPHVSSWWVQAHVPKEHRAVGLNEAAAKLAMAEKAAGPEAQAAPPEAAQTEKKQPAKREPKSPEEKRSYTAGVSCGRGKHNWVDKGTYYRCEGGQNPLCRSTKTKHAPKAEAPAPEPTPGATQPPSLPGEGGTFVTAGRSAAREAADEAYAAYEAAAAGAGMKFELDVFSADGAEGLAWLRSPAPARPAGEAR